MIRGASVCLLGVLVSGCGGGGDGGGANNQPPPPTFMLTEANAVQATAYALAPLEQLLPAGSLALSAAALLRIYGGPQYTTQCSTTPPVTLSITYTDRDANGTVSVGDVVNVPAVDCGGLRRRLTLTLTQLSTALDQVAGRVEADIQFDSTEIVGAFDIALNFSPPSDVTWRVTNAAVTVTQGGTTQTVRLTSAQYTSSAGSYSLSIAGGTVESGHLGGTYTFATTTPLAGVARQLPSSGELLLSTTTGSRVRVVPPATPSNVEEAVEYAVAATSNGPFAPTQQTVWTAIVRGPLFGWRPNVAPTLTSVSIQPSNPSSGASLWVSYFAEDANGDPLQTTIEWRRNGTVVGDNSQWLNVPTARNDKISVTVTVSDGRGLTATGTASITIGNPAPQLTLTLTPPQPDTLADLVATPTVYEPDGDPVTLTYEWRRNGSVIANRTAATLPASETTRGDTVSVRVTASDGASAVEATASTTILDSPPRLSVASPPTTVAHGATVAFTASVTDADGDPVDQLDFLLAYGPAGMTVDPGTGVVNWTAGGPMFDRAMNVNWGITVDGPTAQLATGTLEVTDASRDYALLRFGMQIPLWPAGLSVGDFDDDGDSEMLIMAQRWLFELEADGAGGYRQAWAYPYALHVDTQYSYNSRSSMATGDVNDDGRHEIFAALGPTLTRLDGVERRPVDTLQLGAGEACSDLLYADLEDDGAAELICLASTDYWTATARILVLRAADLSIRHEFPQAAYGRSLAVGNVDTDAAPELVTANGYVFDGATLVNQWLYGPGFGMDVDTGDLDGDGVEEIVAAFDWDFVRGYSATLRTPLWEIRRFDLDSLLVADVAGDARPEILVGDGQSGGFNIYRYNTATNALDVVDHIDSQASGTTAIGVGDVDNDGQDEIIWGSGASSTGADVLLVAGLNPTLTVEWRNSDPIQLDGPFKGGDLAGSAVASRAPLFFSLRTDSGYDGARLVRMPADGGALEISPEIDTNWSGGGALDVVDYDHDGTDEAFLASSAYYNGTFSVYDFFADASEWSSGTQNQSAAADVTHADLTGDGRDELIGFTSSGVVSVHDVYQQTLVWQSTTLNGGRRVFAADVDDDGEAEIVAVTPQAVYVYREGTPSVRFVQAATYQSPRDIIDADVGDTDGDGDAEIVLVVGYSYSSMPTDVVTLDGNLQSLGSFTLPWPAQTIDIEPSTAPRKNLLIGRVAGQYGEAQILAIVGARSGGIVFESPPLIGSVQPGSVHYVTLPGETQPRISIGTSSGMYLTR